MNCNRCGRFRNNKHVCNPVKVLINGKVAYTFTMNSPKPKLKTLSKKSTKNTKKTTHSNLTKGLKGFATMILSCILMYNFCGQLASADYTNSTETYVAPTLSTSTTKAKEVVSAPESIHDKLTRYALKYDIPRQDLWQLVGCETGYTWSPTIRSQGKLKNGQQENSRGLAQINLDAHNISLEEATNPDYALDFIGKHWNERHALWVNCTAKHNL